jgi:hypothetical protein
VVVFVDDLDRCNETSIGEMFEAINSFLPERRPVDVAARDDRPFLGPRFVIGLDSTVVAQRLAERYKGAVTEFDSDDPNAGWAVLRKMAQLTVVLPGIRSSHTTRLLQQHSPGTSGAARTALPASPAAASPAGTDLPTGTGGPGRPQGPSGGANGGRQQPAADAVPPMAFEEDPTVQEHLRQLARLRPRQTMRDTKQLLTLWGFYLRLVPLLQHPSAVQDTQAACDVMTLAEIVRRWPALIRYLGRAGDGPSGLRALISAVADDGRAPQGPRWENAVEVLGLAPLAAGPALANLHGFLAAHGNENVAEFADAIL